MPEELVLYLHCYPLAVAQAAEYARVYKTSAPGEYLEELKRAGLKLAKGKQVRIWLRGRTLPPSQARLYTPAAEKVQLWTTEMKNISRQIKEFCTSSARVADE